MLMFCQLFQIQLHSDLLSSEHETKTDAMLAISIISQWTQENGQATVYYWAEAKCHRNNHSLQ